MSSGEPMTDHTAGQREPSAPSRGSVANHDAVPAAIARTDADRNRTDKAALRPGEGAGNTPAETNATQPRNGTPADGTSQSECTEPVAWAVGYTLRDGETGNYTTTQRRTADHWRDAGCTVVPLYRSLTLTDAERQAIATAMNAYGENNDDAECAQIEQTLWKLLERTK